MEDPPKEANPITLRNKHESPLLRLPGELRNRIYKATLGGKQISIMRPRVYSADVTGSYFHDPDDVPIRRLLHLTEVCRQTHTETELFIFQLNEFRIAGDHNMEFFINALSEKHLGAVRTYVWPRKCGMVKDEMLSKFTGLERIVLQVHPEPIGGDDFYVPVNATEKVIRWYRERQMVARGRIRAWEAKGITIENFKEG